MGTPQGEKELWEGEKKGGRMGKKGKSKEKDKQCCTQDPFG